jgi:predicted nucleotidyltransferase component of viral defense system
MEFNKLEQKRHIEFMKSILEEINKREVPAFLKGGTALLLAHELDRFSEDIDLNAEKNFNLESIIKAAALKENIKDLNIKVVKESKTTKRYKVHYDKNKVLKIEISFRDKIKEKDVDIINNIKTYKVEPLFKMKLSALNNRDKARDMHDVIYLANKFPKFLGKDERKDFLRFSKDLEKIFDFEKAYEKDPILKNSFSKDLEKLEATSKKIEMMMKLETVKDVQKSLKKEKEKDRGVEK